MRWNCETPLASSTAISPSITACDAAMWWGITASSGYWRSQRSPLRDCRRTSSLSRKARARTPSHFTSNRQSSPRGTRSASIAIMGSIDAGISASCAPLRLERSRVVLVLAGAALAPLGGDTAARARLAGGLGGQTRAAAPRGARRLGRRAGGPDAVARARRRAFSLARRQVARDLFLRAAGKHAVGQRFHVPARRGERVALLDEQPLVAFALGAGLHVDNGEIDLQLLAVKAELQIAARQLRLARDIAQQVERAPVPQHPAAAAIVAGRDIAFEIAVLQGVVFHVRGEDLDGGIERRPLGDGPGFQDAIDLQAKVVVQPRGIVPLHTKIRFGRWIALPDGRRRLGRFLEAAFRGVLVERHKPLTSFHLHLIRLCSILKTMAPREAQGGNIYGSERLEGPSDLRHGVFSHPSVQRGAQRNHQLQHAAQG